MSFTLLGILQAQALAGAGGIYQEIASFTVSDTTTSSITFSNLSQDYEALFIQGYLKSRATTEASRSIYYRYNGSGLTEYDSLVSGPNYTGLGNDQTYGQIGSQLSYENASQNDPSWSSFNAYIDDYATSTDVKKLISRFAGGTISTDGSYRRGGFGTSQFRNTANITSIEFTISDGSNFQQNSEIKIFGMAGA